MQIVERIANILQELSSVPDGLTLSELSEVTGLPPGTCHRLLGGLEDVRLVGRDETSLRWKPGVGLLQIASGLYRSSSTASIDRALEALRDRWQECFFVAVLSQDEVICIRSIETSDPHRVSVTVPLGRRLPLHASASAKAILADLPVEVSRRMLGAAPRPRFTESTRTRIADVERDLVQTRARGYSTCDQEMEAGVIAHAVHLGGASDGHRSLGVIGPRERLMGEAGQGLLDALVATAQELDGVIAPSFDGAARLARRA